MLVGRDVNGDQVVFGRRPHRLAMANDINNPLQIHHPSQMMLHTDLLLMYMFRHDFIELFCRDLKQMVVLAYLTLQCLLVIGQVFD